MRSISVKLYIVLSLSLFFSGCGYNRLVKLEQELEESWVKLEVLFEEREDFNEELLLFLEGHGYQNIVLTGQLENHRREIFKITVKLKEQDTLDQFLRAQGHYARDLSRLIVEGESLPLLQMDVYYRELKDEWLESNRNLEIQLVEFQENRLEYNRYLDTWPRSFFARWLGFLPYEEQNIEAKTVLLNLPSL